MTTTTNSATTNRTKCEVWSRVMGYQRPVDFYNTGKKSEFYSRKYFTENNLSNQSFNQKFSPKTK